MIRIEKIKTTLKDYLTPTPGITCEKINKFKIFLAIYQKRSCDQKPNVYKNNLCVPSSFKKNGAQR